MKRFFASLIFLPILLSASESEDEIHFATLKKGNKIVYRAVDGRQQVLGEGAEGFPILLKHSSKDKFQKILDLGDDETSGLFISNSDIKDFGTKHGAAANGQVYVFEPEILGYADDNTSLFRTILITAEGVAYFFERNEREGLTSIYIGKKRANLLIFREKIQYSKNEIFHKIPYVIPLTEKRKAVDYSIDCNFGKENKRTCVFDGALKEFEVPQKRYPLFWVG
ncbi:hypothetical protein LEP1GSC047_3696 [Leptospira inadai serovar Lyme str. 10]|uniref:Uncharacterized protein n=2 Tax=Leptospira inadai serovar Lyme TaxID=293084 RepID=V6HM74_9LEPT|nr:hypothetical protein [Leptospira inadai]EQA37985.1 hypothetical protein LEP1GSC047_3696 [Leptospira inadai serovar Lyme str. 10]PNV75042.1 hypothetical protein BES34_010765 [Leptospira inadai serovar Lyme]